MNYNGRDFLVMGVCPYCGSIGTYTRKMFGLLGDEWLWHWFECSGEDCGFRTPRQLDPEEALESWNAARIEEKGEMK